jgi:hypothetical protein
MRSFCNAATKSNASEDTMEEEENWMAANCKSLINSKYSDLILLGSVAAAWLLLAVLRMAS